MVPLWLTGTWTRTYIRRRLEEKLGDPDSSVQVTYIQTPWAFVDIRSKVRDGNEKSMAFAGVTVVKNEESSSIPPLVKWHACLDMDEMFVDCQERWIEAEDQPRPTTDVGYFQDVSNEVSTPHTYHEYNPDRTYLEQWVRIDDGGEKFLAVRDESGQRVLVVAGKYWAYASQSENVFVSGIIKDCQYENKKSWLIESSATERSKETKSVFFELPNQAEISWKLLKGSTLPLGTIHSLM